MSLVNVTISNVRTIRQAQLALHPQLNFIIGNNGSGKTSFLEALYLLFRGQSFRTREHAHVINHDADRLSVCAETADGETISIQKSLSKSTQIQLNHLSCQSTSELARLFPCQLFYQDIFEIIDAGPLIRRNVLDWGLFYFIPQYNDVWKAYKHALKQRNALLKQQAPSAHFVPWDKLLTDLAEELHQYRKDYFQQLEPVFKQFLNRLCNVECTLHYFKGWDRRNTGKSLALTLEENYNRDLLRQYTQYGAHAADLLIGGKDGSARYYFSRGYQKMILFALKFAQSQLTQTPCRYLCDDLTVELDPLHCQKLFELIESTPGQFFITATQIPYFGLNNAQTFLIEDGSIVTESKAVQSTLL